jgi:endonuclease/exonuclease/phosphatase family metal-dependent hydrolase
MLWFFLATFFAFFQGTEPDQLDRIWKAEFTSPREVSNIRTVDWNIDRGTEFDEVAQTLEGAHPDLCLLQEVDLFDRRSGDRNVAEALAKRLEMNYAIIPSFQELSQAGSGKAAYQGEAILTRMPILGVRVIRFQRQSTWWRPRSFLPNIPVMQRRDGGRTALVAELKTPYGEMVVYNAHLESRSMGEIQMAQLREILDDARRYPDITPILLAGDFNTLYTSKTFLDTLERAGYRSAFGRAIPRTHKITGKLDWILVHGPLRTENPSVMTKAQGSDHFPVAATVVLPAPAQPSGAQPR